MQGRLLLRKNKCNLLPQDSALLQKRPLPRSWGFIWTKINSHASQSHFWMLRVKRRPRPPKFRQLWAFMLYPGAPVWPLSSCTTKVGCIIDNVRSRSSTWWDQICQHALRFEIEARPCGLPYRSGAFQQYQYTYIIHHSQLRVFLPLEFTKNLGNQS